MKQELISKELREELEKIPCTLKCGSNFQFLSQDSKGNIKMKCLGCSKKGLSNIISITVKPKRTKEVQSK